MYLSSAEILNISKCLAVAVESILHSQIALAAALASRASKAKATAKKSKRKKREQHSGFQRGPPP